MADVALFDAEPEAPVYELDTPVGVVRGRIVAGSHRAGHVFLEFTNRHGYRQHVEAPRTSLREVTS